MSTVKTRTSHYCPDCKHEADNHGEGGGARCCFGWCPCTKRDENIKRQNPAVQAPAWPAYDEATGKWAANSW